MKKRIFSVLTALCLCATLIVTAMVFSVNAEGSAKISAGSASGKKGETVTVNVNLSSNPGLTGLVLDTSYDTSKLKLVGVNGSGVLSGYGSQADYSGSSYRLYWDDSLATQNNTSTGTIATLTFEIVDDISDSTPVNLSVVEAIDKDLADVPASASGGSVSPKSSSDATTKAPDASVTTTGKANTTTTKKSTSSTTKKPATTTKRATTTRQNSYDNYEPNDIGTTEYTELSTDYWWMTEVSSTEPETESQTETTTEAEEEGRGTLSRTKMVLVILMVCFAIIGVSIIVSIVKKSKN